MCCWETDCSLLAFRAWFVDALHDVYHSHLASVFSNPRSFGICTDVRQDTAGDLQSRDKVDAPS